LRRSRGGDIAYLMTGLRSGLLHARRCRPACRSR
jgi:hypothetical protein